MDFKKKILLIITGVVTGVINGFFGGGGGMIVVPMLTILLGLKEKYAHATAIAVIFPITIVSVITYFISGGSNFGTKNLISTAVGVTLGGVAGAFLLKKIENKSLVKIFAIVMLVAGVKMLLF